MLSFKTPGVYIEELPAVGPIEGVGTSTAAFIGPGKFGPINSPTKITNWTQFVNAFGDYIMSPRIYLAYGVRGFFENGGTVAYIVRVSKAARASLELDDRKTPGLAGKALRIEAHDEGPAGNTIKVAVQDAQIVAAAANARVRRARAAISNAALDTVRLANIADAAIFRPGDVVTIEGSEERAEIDRISADQLILTTNLTANFAAGFVRIADLQANQRIFRVENGSSLEPGSVIKLDQAGGSSLEPGSVIKVDKAGGNNENSVVDRVNGEFITLAGSGLTKTYTLAQGDQPVAITSFEFNLVITKGAVTENYINLSMDARHSRYFGRIVNSTLVAVSLPQVPSVQVPPLNRAAEVGATYLAGGTADKLDEIGFNEYQKSLQALEKVDDVNLVCVPDRTDAGVQGEVVAHCERMGDRFAILDSAFNAEPSGPGSILTQRAAVESQRGYAALYYPWIRIQDPSSLTGDETLLVPPSGHLAGIFARSDDTRGVHKAPANELIRSAVGLERIIDGTEQGELNIEGINVLRVFAGKVRPIVWGARTTVPKADTAYRYVNVRRLLIFVEVAIKRGIQWSVFEPNDLTLWKKLDRTISEFLNRVWRSGALFGATAEQAFYVKIDEELNPPSVRNLGQVIIEIGIAPVRPAEFVIVRIGLWDGGSEVQES